MVRTAILVEGDSDRNALEALARKLNRDLGDEEVEIVAMGGASRLYEHVQRFLPDAQVVGLCDIAEVAEVRRGLSRVGWAADDLESIGFHVCDEDLEDELIRALGVDAAVAVIEAEGELGAFRRMQSQPQWRGRPADAQIRRWIGAGSGRKLRYARLFVEALELDQVPPPLLGVLASV